MSQHAESSEMLSLCLHLVRACELRRQTMERDKMLVLAGVAAAELGLNPLAEYCRRQILASNPGHMVRGYHSFSAAHQDETFKTYLHQVRRNYPREKLEHMLRSLGIERGNERATYDNDYEYAAGLLGTTPAELEASLREEADTPQGPALEERATNWPLTIALLAALLGVVAFGVWKMSGGG